MFLRALIASMTAFHSPAALQFTLVDPKRPETDNLIWKYHWTVSNELERRSWTTLERALKLAEEP